MHTDDKELLTRQLTSLKVASALIEGWVAKRNDPHPEKGFGRLLARLENELAKAQDIVKEHRGSMLAAIADRHNQADHAFKTADVVSINVAKDRREALKAAK